MALSFGSLFNAGNAEHVGKLEDWGYDSVWTSEHILFHGPTLEGLSVLAFYAGRTKSIRLGTAVYLLPLRHPTVVAKTVTTIDILSGGRVTLGIGVGGEFPKEFEATGIPLKERGSRTSEAITVMKRLWTESNVTHEGRHFQFSDVTMEPRPVQQPHPPIIVAGRSDAAQRRAGRLGDGYMPYLYDLGRYEKGMETVRAAAREAGRDLDAEPFTWSIYLFTCVAKTMEDARRIAAARLQRTYQQPFENLVDRYTALGTPDDCAERIAQFARLGATEFILVPLADEEGSQLSPNSGPAQLEKVQLIAEDIIPKVRKAVGE